MDWIKANKTIVIIGSVVIAVVLAGGFLLTRGKSEEKVTAVPTPTPPTVELLAQDALDVKLKPGADRQYVLTIDKIPSGVATISYEITYDTKDKGTQGIVGSPVPLKDGQTKYTNDKIIFGTCSRNKCVYDSGVANIQISVRLDFKDGSEKGWKGTLEI